MTSLTLLADYASSSDDEGEQNKMNSVPTVSSSQGMSSTIVATAQRSALPSASDMFSDSFIARPNSIAPKRGRMDAFGAGDQTGKSSYTRLDDSVAAAPDKVVKPAAPTVFKPPQLKRPNTVTEDVKLWNSQSKGEKKK